MTPPVVQVLPVESLLVEKERRIIRSSKWVKKNGGECPILSSDGYKRRCTVHRVKSSEEPPPRAVVTQLRGRVLQ